MHHCELVDLAALLATHAKTIIAGVDELHCRHFERYWSVAKCRHDRWSRSFKAYTSEIQQSHDRGRRAPWRSIRPVLEEILTGEILTRIWTSVVCAHDRLRGTYDVEPVVQSVFVGHLEARSRALNLMVHGQGFDVEEAVELNRLRHRAERWSDLLLGQLVGQIDVSDFAFDPERAQDFAADINFEYRQGKGKLAWELLLTSLRAAFQSGLSAASPNSDLNQQLAESILSCIPADLFDSTGLFKSLWLVRLDCTTNETQLMIDEFLSLDNPDLRVASCQQELRRPDDYLPRF